MHDVDQLFEMAKEILKRRYGLRFVEADIDRLARQVVAKPIDTSLTQSEIKRELGKRVTERLNAQFPHYKPRRLGRGGWITIGDAPPRGRRRAVSDHTGETDPESQKDLTDKILSEKALDSSASTHNRAILREKEKSADMVEDLLQQTSPTNSAALEELLPAVGVGDSLGQLGREVNRKPMQVKRAFDEAREVLEGRRPRRPHPAPDSNGSPVQGVEYSPPTVSDESRWRLHDGAVISDIGAEERRTITSNGHKRESRPKDIFSVPRPKWADYVEHPLFGRGALLRNLRDDDNVWVDFDKPDENRKRRRVMRRDSLKFLGGKQKP
jgi:hypothetical protein